MNTTRIRVLATVALAAALGLATVACDSSNNILNPPGAGGSSLTAKNSTPSDGDATLTVGGTFVVNSGGTGFDELNLSEMVGAVGHDVTITWDTNTHALHSASHGWGSGYTQCVMGTANPCDTARVTIDFAGSSITFTDLVLIDDVFGTAATSTLDGTATW